VLCVATVQLRKGVQYLMEAARLLKGQAVQIRLIGPCAVSDQALAELKRHLQVVGTIPRSEMRQEFADADLFVLPTLSEGSAIVCYEALAAGLPVITTPGAGSVVRDGIEGMIVPIRDAQALVSVITELQHEPERLQAMSEAATDRAGEYTLRAYHQRLLDLIIPDAVPEAVAINQ
jgi:glycosyltransferase involved in cell wall biosynthesis